MRHMKVSKTRHERHEKNYILTWIWHEGSMIWHEKHENIDNRAWTRMKKSVWHEITWGMSSRDMRNMRKKTAWTGMTWTGMRHEMTWDMNLHDMRSHETWIDMTWGNMTWIGMNWHETAWNGMKWHEFFESCMNRHDMKWHENGMTWHDMRNGMNDMTWETWEKNNGMNHMTLETWEKNVGMTWHDMKCGMSGMTWAGMRHERHENFTTWFPISHEKHEKIQKSGMRNMKIGMNLAWNHLMPIPNIYPCSNLDPK